jgi:hypothetical protein
MSTEQKRRLALIAFIVVLLGAWAWWTTRSRRSDALAVAECVQLYGRAVTAADTLEVDSVRPIQGLTRQTTCGSMRSQMILDQR